MVSWFSEEVSRVYDAAGPTNTKKTTKLGLTVFIDTVLCCSTSCIFNFFLGQGNLVCFSCNALFTTFLTQHKIDLKNKKNKRGEERESGIAYMNEKIY